MLQPISVDETEIRHVALGMQGGPAAANRARLRIHEFFQGPMGFGSPDDAEVWDRVQHGAQGGSDLWIMLNRGLNHEENLPDGAPPQRCQRRNRDAGGVCAMEAADGGLRWMRSPHQPVISLEEAMQFVWLEADLLDSAGYDAWLALWTPTSRYVVPIDPGTTDFENTLNYAYDDAAMRQKRADRLTSGQSVSASPVARTVRLISRFRLLETDGGGVPLALRPDADRVPPRAGAHLRGRHRVPLGADGGRAADRAQGRPPGERDRSARRHRLHPVSEAGPRVALVTGAGGGLGSVLAAGLHEAGYCVAVADIDEPAAAAVASPARPGRVTTAMALGSTSARSRSFAARAGGGARALGRGARAGQQCGDDRRRGR